MKIGDQEIALDSQTKYIILDTGMSLGIIPTSDFNSITKYLKKSYGISFENESNLSIANISSKKFKTLPDIQIEIGGKFILMDPKTYLYRVSASNNYYALAMTPEDFIPVGEKNNSKYWIVGD